MWMNAGNRPTTVATLLSAATLEEASHVTAGRGTKETALFVQVIYPPNS